MRFSGSSWSVSKWSHQEAAAAGNRGRTLVRLVGARPVLLFNSLCVPTGCGDRAMMMPQRRRTRAQNRPTTSPPNAGKTTERASRATAQDTQFPTPDPSEPPPF